MSPRIQIGNVTKRFKRAGGKVIVPVDNISLTVDENGHRVAVLQSGRIAALDTPRGVYEEPPTHYVANFVGVSNFLPGTVRGIDAGAAVVATTHGVFHAAGGAQSWPAGTSVLLVLRPEKIALAAERPATAHAVQGKIVDIAYEGDRSIFHVDVDGTLMTVSAMPNDSHRRGDPVWLGWAADAAHVLDE